MANRNFASGGKIYTMHVKPIMAECSITLGASGAVSSFSGNLVKSVTQSSTGTYLITMQDNYNNLLGIINMLPKVSSSTSGIVQIEQIGSFSPNITGASVSIQTLNSSDAVANGNSGAVISVLLYLNDSTVI